jgi:HEAT repeat protein
VERVGGGLASRAEDLLRLLAGAANAVRLYPPSSPLRDGAIARFAEGARIVTAAHGPVQYRVDRERFLLGDTPLGEAFPQVAALAETLHALQVGQLIVAPALTADEVLRFLDIIGGDAKAVRASGGIRAALKAAGVQNLAVVEVTLRASSEAGIVGLDLTSAPLEDIARELTAATAAWTHDAERGAEAADAVRNAVDRLEPAARDLAMRRCAEALRYLDENTRTMLLAGALTADGTGTRMDGMLSVISRMTPAALARLLRLVAQRSGQEPGALMGASDLPPEVARKVAALLKPAPSSDPDRGIPAEADADAIVGEIVSAGEEDFSHINELVRSVTVQNAAARGLTTTIQVAGARRTEEAVRAVADALAPAVKAGAFDEIAAAAELLAELAADPGLAAAVAAARQVLSAPDLLSECVRRLIDDPEALGARMLIESVGPAGADALIEGYLAASEMQRAQLLPVIAPMAEAIAPVTGRILRSGASDAASAVVRLLGSIGSRRLVPTMALALDHLDSRVRSEAVAALAGIPGPESAQLLQKALGHWDPETRRAAAREIGRAGVVEAVPALLRIVAVQDLFERNYELKKEALKSLEALHSPQAIPVLTRIARRPLAIGKRSRELRYLARRVLETLADR